MYQLTWDPYQRKRREWPYVRLTDTKQSYLRHPWLYGHPKGTVNRMSVFVKLNPMSLFVADVKLNFQKGAVENDTCTTGEGVVQGKRHGYYRQTDLGALPRATRY